MSVFFGRNQGCQKPRGGLLFRSSVAAQIQSKLHPCETSDTEDHDIFETPWMSVDNRYHATRFLHISRRRKHPKALGSCFRENVCSDHVDDQFPKLTLPALYQDQKFPVQTISKPLAVGGVASTKRVSLE